MKQKLQAEIAQITENYNMGFLTAFEAMMQTYDAMMQAAEDIADEKERDEYYAKVSKCFDNEHMVNAYCELSTEWINE